jgi:hypothetical protein
MIEFSLYDLHLGLSVCSMHIDNVNIALFTIIGILVMTIIGTYGYDGYRRLRSPPADHVEGYNMITSLLPTPGLSVAQIEDIDEIQRPA